MAAFWATAPSPPPGGTSSGVTRPMNAFCSVTLGTALSSDAVDRLSRSPELLGDRCPMLDEAA
jgi:hypothetical protein